MIVGTLFSGIEGGGHGAERAGAEIAWQVENNRFCNRVLKHRYPGVERHGDIEGVDGRKLRTVDAIFFGSPCQDLSVAGRQTGLAARSGLFFQAARIINECRPAFAVWENVPGAFSANGGRDFATVLYTLRELGANDVAWRVYDSQYAGVPQQRRRIYLVADFRGRRAGEILFDLDRCGGHPAPSFEARTDLAGTLTSGIRGSGGQLAGRGSEDDYNLVAKAITPRGFKGDRGDDPTGVVVARALTSAGDRQDATVDTYVIQDVRGGARKEQNGLGVRHAQTAYTLDAGSTPAIAFHPDVLHRNGTSVTPSADTTGNVRLRDAGLGIREGTAYSLNTGDPGAVAFDPNQITSRNNRSNPRPGLSHTLPGQVQGPMFADGFAIRRFTPVECERLQGLPDGWTCLCGAEGDIWNCRCSDGPRYRAIGNAMTETVACEVAAAIKRML